MASDTKSITAKKKKKKSRDSCLDLSEGSAYMCQGLIRGRLNANFVSVPLDAGQVAHTGFIRTFFYDNKQQINWRH